jgi:hypothetical protein
MGKQVSPVSSVSTPQLYDRDYYLWLAETARQLREGQFVEIDLESLIEEIESMGRSEKRELESRLEVIIEHLLKCLYWESERACNLRGWQNTILEQRSQLYRVLRDSPSLQNQLPELFADIYTSARRLFLRKSDLLSDLVPIEPPFTMEQVLDFDFLP